MMLCAPGVRVMRPMVQTERAPATEGKCCATAAASRTSAAVERRGAAA